MCFWRTFWYGGQFRFSVINIPSSSASVEEGNQKAFRWTRSTEDRPRNALFPYTNNVDIGFIYLLQGADRRAVPRRLDTCSTVRLPPVLPPARTCRVNRRRVPAGTSSPSSPYTLRHTRRRTLTPRTTTSHSIRGIRRTIRAFSRKLFIGYYIM